MWLKEILRQCLINLMEEEWKQIREYPNYEVSNHGRVRNIVKDKIISNSRNKHGYYTVHLAKDGIHKTHNLHSLVARYFVPNPFRLTMVDHIDRNRLNNVYSNLRFCTRQQNARNISNRVGGSSCYKGVCFVKRTGKWRATLCDTVLGHFDSEVAAALAYDKKARETCSYFSLNFPSTCVYD